MLEVGWTEMLVIAVVMIVVVGPKDLPGMLRSFGRTTAKMRKMAGDFQRQFNEALQEAELDDVKKSVDALRSLNPATEIKKQLNPFEQAASDVRAGLQSLNPQPPPSPPSPNLQPAEPLKTGASALPEAAAAPATPQPAPVPAAAKATKAPATKPAAKAPAKPAAKAAAKPAAKKTTTARSKS
ncbi:MULTISPECIES: Sec-independent protein translocase protein TatB [Mesorhizobium]|uniref:Sec-independent protein translocase protein TatB n=1 Tax=Mesorhizobium denitrificans TaxID=2294114 RepID=A0A371XDP6_9HYPH|nr:MULTISPECIES: Sec-independent protein translocase protein TatB [Mesorhizobium]RFC67355.1 twin-arginine translocase subunit TatB [Mesorhizobium denitrificans]